MRFKFKSIPGAIATILVTGGLAWAANTALSNLSASGAIAGANLIYVVQTAGTGGVKATFTQVATFINSLFSGDCTVASGGAVTCTGPTHLSGTAPSLTAGTVTTNANLTGDVTSSGNATTLTNAPVIAKVLTGFTSGAGTVSAADSILAALQKINGNDALKAPLASPTLTGTPAAPTATVGTNTTQLATTAFVIANAGSGTGANPTATAGPTAVNGVATTFMRSDAAPAIQLATAAQKGVAQVDGTTITASAGVISTATSISAGCGTSTGGSPITAAGTVSAAITRRANTATTDTLISTDCGNIVSESNAASIAVAIAQAGTTGFANGTYFSVCNIGVGTATITPTTSTIGGASTYALPGGTAAAPKCVGIQSDGTNYNVVPDWFAVGALATITPGTGVATAAAANLSAAGGLTSTIASGTAALGTSAIGSGACATVVTVTATNVATTDVVSFSYNGDPTAITGYGASATGAVLTIYPYPSSGNVNVKVCNSSSASITPSAMTLNWRVWR